MRKKQKKFIALLMVFTLIMSFGFGTKPAKADDATDAATIRVKVEGASSQLPYKTDDLEQVNVYSTDQPLGDTTGFDLTVKDVRTTESKLKQQAQSDPTKPSTVTGVVSQVVSIKKINEVDYPSDPDHVLRDLGIAVQPLGNGTIGGVAGTDNGEQVIGQRILKVPLGINRIEYDVQVGTETVTYTPVKDASGNVISSNTVTSINYSNNTSNKKLVIEHGAGFVTSQINSLQFKSYVGDANQFLDNDEVTIKDNNKSPFLYIQDAKPDSDMALRYTFDLPDSTKILKYMIKFGSTLDTVYNNGKADGTSRIVANADGSTGSTITGQLDKIGDHSLIMLHTNGISKTYAVEIRYKTIDAKYDYSLKDAGITKLNYDANSDVKAYIGKTFNVNYDSQSGFKVFNGSIYIDNRAGMISMDPDLICKGQVQYGAVITNHYTNSNGDVLIKNSQDYNGKQYIDFMAGIKNQLYVDICEKNGSGQIDSSKILARYILDVNQEGTSNFKMDLTFGTTGAAAVYLTQPGIKGNLIDKFSTDRRTYDLYFGAPAQDSVNVAFTGTRSSLNEYIRVWLADDPNSNDLKEADASKNNNFQKVGNNYVRNTELNVKVGTAKKMVVQAYYDEFEYTKDSNNNQVIKTDNDGNPVYKSYPLGYSYVFYLPENYGNTSKPGQGQSSDNAALNSLKIKGYTLKNNDGGNGFSSDKYDYSTTVNKEDTSEKLTVVAQDDNVKSITATINGSSDSYTLGSGQEEELPLNSNGTTVVKITVTAQDGKTAKTYTVTITNNTKSSNVKLKNVILNTGDYTFDPTVDVTKVRVDPNVSSIQVTPIPEDPKAVVSVNGENYSGSPIIASLKGNQKTEITIEVQSEDGQESKTYTLEVYRVSTADWDNKPSDTNASDDDQYYDDFNNCWVDTTKYEEWGTVNGKPAYFDNHNRQVKNAWITTGGKNYYLNNLGYRASGWKIDDVDGKAYYLDSTTGEMKKGWINLSNSWYYLDPNGVMHKGWLYLNGKWYYFTPNGQMVINQSMFVEDKTYNFGQDGAVIF